MERRRASFAVLAGFALAVGFLEGGPYPLAFCGLTIAILLAAVAALRKSWWPLYVLGLIFCFAVGFSAIKLLPAYIVSVGVRLADLSRVALRAGTQHSRIDAVHTGLRRRSGGVRYVQ